VWAATGYERQPVLKASDLAPAEWLKGSRFQVDEQVPTDGFLARLTIRSDVGTFEAYGLDMLKIRIAELATLESLAAASKTVTFLKVLGSTAEHPVKAVESFVTHPVDTVPNTFDIMRRRTPEGHGLPPPEVEDMESRAPCPCVHRSA
jgi:hypothetical protein